jgi:hypothetical protein
MLCLCVPHHQPGADVWRWPLAQRLIMRGTGCDAAAQNRAWRDGAAQKRCAAVSGTQGIGADARVELLALLHAA